MNSLLQSVTQLGIQTPFSLRENLQTHPDRLSEVLRIMNLPKPDLRQLEYRRIHAFTEKNPQGVAYGGGDTWFLSSEWNLFKYRITGGNLYNPARMQRLQKRHLRDLLAPTNLNEGDFDHIGDIDYLNGVLFAPIRHRSKAPPHVLLALSTDLTVVGYMILSDTTGDVWCTVNPWESILYLPRVGNDTMVEAYDPSELLALIANPTSSAAQIPTKRLPSRDFHFLREDASEDAVHSIQGMVLTPNGRIYLSRYSAYSGSGPWKNYIHVYDALTGVRLDASSEYDFPGVGDEIEGLSAHPSGMLLVAVADNDWPSTDEFELFAFRYATVGFPT